MYIGKLRAWDAKKNQYYLFNDGKNPLEEKDSSKWRSTLLWVVFGSQKMQSIGNIRTTMMYMQKIEEDTDSHNDTLKKLRFENPAEIMTDSETIALNDKKPKWSDAKNKFVYNFNGRWNKASVKNTQLVPLSYPFWHENVDDVEEVPIFQFGRWDNNLFNIDFYHPLSILNAFALSLAIFDTN